MKPFAFNYEGIPGKATVEQFTEDGYQRYRVVLSDSIQFVIAPSGIAGANNKIIWVQSNKSFEIIQPHDFVQVLGEAVENTMAIEPVH